MSHIPLDLRDQLSKQIKADFGRERVHRLFGSRPTCIRRLKRLKPRHHGVWYLIINGPMDTFEYIVALLLDSEGYWTRASFKVELNREEKRKIGRPTAPRWEIDVVGYKPADNLILAVECKSYLDSPGVAPDDLSSEGKWSSHYKLFNDHVLREIVLSRLTRQLNDLGMVASNPEVKLVLAAGKVRRDTEDVIKRVLLERGHGFYGPSRIVEFLKQLSTKGYENEIATVVAKMIYRNRDTAYPGWNRISSRR